MEWDKDIDLSRRKYSSRLIVEQALARGWRVCGFVTNPAIFLLYIPGRDEPLKIFSASPPQTSYAAVKVTRDKFITNRLLEEAGLPVPKEVVIQGEVEDKHLDFMRTHGRVIVKPLDASHGNGITVNVDTPEKLRDTVAMARTANAKGISSVLVQEQLPGIDVRILCINYKYVDSMARSPASVVGDGKHSIKELIGITNGSPERGENYRARLNLIPIKRAQQFLGDEGLGRVPAEGESAQVVGISNIGIGGERENIRDRIPGWMGDMAAKASTILGTPVCGIDFMVSHLPSANSTQEELQPRIIEANECPSLTLYEDLHSPEQLKVIDTYLDYVQSY